MKIDDQVNSIIFAPQKWLIDQEIQFALTQLEQQFPNKNIFISVYEWPLLKTNVDIEANARLFSELTKAQQEEKELVFIPVNNPNTHWSLLVYEIKNSKFYHLDSSEAKLNEEYIKDIVNHLCQHKKAEFLEPTVPHQSNSYDCGIYLITFIKLLSENTNLLEIGFPEIDSENERNQWREMVDGSEKEFQNIQKPLNPLIINEQNEQKKINSNIEKEIKIKESKEFIEEKKEDKSAKNILLIGKTGSGKSALANVLTNTNEFEESSESVSKTKEVKSKIFHYSSEEEKLKLTLSEIIENEEEIIDLTSKKTVDLIKSLIINDSKNKEKERIKYQVIDTVGINDTQLSHYEVLDRIAESVYLARHGIHQIFFVVNGRLGAEETSIYNILKTIIFDEQSTQHTSIIRTKFEEFDDEKKIQEDIEIIIKEEKTSKIAQECQNRFIHVDNKEIDKSCKKCKKEKFVCERCSSIIEDNKSLRNDSREKIFDHLNILAKKENYIPSKLTKLSSSINKLMEDRLFFINKLEELKNKPSIQINKKEVEVFIDKISNNQKIVTNNITEKVILEILNDKYTNFIFDYQIISEEFEKVFTEVKIKSLLIKKCEDKVTKLKRQIQENQSKIREKVYLHIFNNCKINSLEEKALINKLDSELNDWVQLPNFTDDDYGFCAWLKKIGKLSLNEVKSFSELEILKLRENYFNYLNEEQEICEKFIDRQNEVISEQIKKESSKEWKKFLSKKDDWTSGNSEIDEFIRKNQEEANELEEILEWIPYDQFENIELFAKGGFSNVYKADWSSGPIKKWNNTKNNWERKKNKQVALKALENFQDIIVDFLREISFHKLVDKKGCGVSRFYGISKNPANGNYVIVMKYLENDNLRKYLKEKSNELKLKDKFQLILNIIKGLESIHDKKIIHCDIHPGDILVGKNNKCYISDFGLSQPANYQNKDNKKIFGILPYIAPEVLQGHDYTQLSDIYSFGMVVYEVITGYFPFRNEVWNNVLINRIVFNQLRPTISVKLPEDLTNIIEDCWQSNPNKRPIAEKLKKRFEELLEKEELDNYSEFNHPYQIDSNIVPLSQLINTNELKIKLDNFENLSTTKEFIDKFSHNEKTTKTLTDLNQESNSSIQEHQWFKSQFTQQEPIFREEIGRGSSGKVYRGIWKNQEVAVKEVKRKENIKEELKLLRDLKSKYIIQYYGEYQKSEQEWLIIMELAEHGSLANFIYKNKNNLHNWPLNYNFIKNMVRGLRYLHSEGVLHRDLKSHNVLISEGYIAKLTDFGLAKLVENYHESSTSQGITGTIRWMAPEVLRKNNHSYQSDIYSLGMIMWEIAAKEIIPFKQINNNHAVIYNIVFNNLREDIPTDTPEELKEIVQSCWRENPQKRINLEEIDFKINKLIYWEDKTSQIETKIEVMTN